MKFYINFTQYSIDSIKISWTNFPAINGTKLKNANWFHSRFCVITQNLNPYTLHTIPRGEIGFAVLSVNNKSYLYGVWTATDNGKFSHFSYDLKHKKGFYQTLHYNFFCYKLHYRSRNLKKKCWDQNHIILSEIFCQARWYILIFFYYRIL